MSEQGPEDRGERRAAPRYPLQAPVEFNDGAGGTGTTENISVSGVLIEDSTFQVEVRSDVILHFSFFAGSFGIPFLGTVVRHSSGGFAVRFFELGSPQREVLREALPPDAFEE
jgi:hypothetical protein